jgi:hypothetical protein
MRYRPYFDIDLPFGLGCVSFSYPVDHKKTVLGSRMTCDEPIKRNGEFMAGDLILSYLL